MPYLSLKANNLGINYIGMKSINKKINILHLIPCNVKGGVEVGALRAKKDLNKKFNYRVKFIYRAKDNKLKKLIKGFFNIFYLIKITNKNDKTVLISSIWQSHILAFIVNLLQKKLIWVSFIHNTNYPSFINKIVCNKITLFSNQIIFDSESSALTFYKKKYNNKNNIIHFYFKDYKFPKFNIKKWKKRKIDFITVARNINQKGFFELEKFCINSLKNLNYIPKILIITDNLYNEVNLIKMKKKLNQKFNINIKMNLKNSKVLYYMTQSKYYLCLSKYEGFGATIAEALKSGCFILTTNVGEQKNYLYSNRKYILRDINNSINFKKIITKADNLSYYNRSIIFFEKKVSFYTDKMEQFISTLKFN